MHKKQGISREIAVYGGMLAFGIAYNRLIGWTERKKMIEGFTAYAVALGVSVTLGGVALKDKRAALQSFLGFVFTGTPMLIGATWRYMQARRLEQKYVRQTKRMAL